MKAEELRIGNYIYDDFNEVHKVESIQSDAMIHYDGTHESNVKFSKIDDPHSIYECDTVNPIPLTEEWLLRLGFNTDYKKGYIGIDVNHTDFVLTYPKIMGEWQNHFAFEFQAGGWPRYVQLKYVHQLQNLYYALTGEELK